MPDLAIRPVGSAMSSVSGRAEYEARNWRVYARRSKLDRRVAGWLLLCRCRLECLWGTIKVVEVEGEAREEASRLIDIDGAPLNAETDMCAFLLPTSYVKMLPSQAGPFPLAPPLFYMVITPGGRVVVQKKMQDARLENEHRAFSALVARYVL